MLLAHYNFLLKVLFQGLHASAAQIITIVMAFLVICFGITILQMSKVDPEKLSKLDRRSTLLLRVSREHTGNADEKGSIGMEDPGMDALRGSFGTVGSIIRARTVKRMSQSTNSNSHLRPPGAAAPHVVGIPSWVSAEDGLTRHQLYDAPMPRTDDEQLILSNSKRSAIKFGEQDLVHSYSRPGQGDLSVKHEHRQAGGSMTSRDAYPPLPLLSPPEQKYTVTEGNLLEMDSPEIKRKIPTTRRLLIPEDHTLLLPGSESEIHSAPPTICTRFTKDFRSPPSSNRKELRDMFQRSNASTEADADNKTTMMTSPSVRDSAPCEWGDEGTEVGLTMESLHPRSKDVKTEPSKEREREKHRPRTPRKYPKNGGDEEETESLWHKNAQEEDSEEGSIPPDLGSVRLVETSLKRV